MNRNPFLQLSGCHINGRLCRAVQVENFCLAHRAKIPEQTFAHRFPHQDDPVQAGRCGAKGVAAQAKPQAGGGKLHHLHRVPLHQGRCFPGQKHLLIVRQHHGNPHGQRQQAFGNKGIEHHIGGAEDRPVQTGHPLFHAAQQVGQRPVAQHHAFGLPG